MREAGPPYLSCSRPALTLLGSLSRESAPFAFADVARSTGRPRTTLVRLLAELVRAHLLLRVHRDQYRLPASEVTAWLLAEPRAYLRSLYLYHSVYRESGRKGWAFGCFLVRAHMDFEIPQAIPVMPPDLAELRSHEPLSHPEALRYSYRDSAVRIVRPEKSIPRARPPPPGCEALPCLRPLEALALLAATADPRLAKAARKASVGLNVDAARMISLARSMHPEMPPIRVLWPNTVVYPRWLGEFSRTAAQLHSRRSLAEVETDNRPARVLRRTGG